MGRHFVNVIEKAINSHHTILYTYTPVGNLLYNQLLQIRDLNFVNGLPESLCDVLLLPQRKNNLLIIGDLMNDASNN